MKILSINHLKKEAYDSKEPEILQEFYVSLVGGLARSSKRIHYDGGIFTIHHEIDDVFEELTENALKESNIHIAIKAGNLYRIK